MTAGRPSHRTRELDRGDGVRPQSAGDRSQAPPVLTMLTSSPASQPRLTFRGTDVLEVLIGPVRKGRPRQRVVSRDVDLWAYQRGVAEFSRPGKPTDDASIKAFHGRPSGPKVSTRKAPALCGRVGKVETWRFAAQRRRNPPANVIKGAHLVLSGPKFGLAPRKPRTSTGCKFGGRSGRLQALRLNGR